MLTMLPVEPQSRQDISRSRRNPPCKIRSTAWCRSSLWRSLWPASPRVLWWRQRFPLASLKIELSARPENNCGKLPANCGEQLKEATSKAGQRLAAAADERGLNTEGLKEVARDVGEAFNDALEKEDVNQTARSGARTSSTKSVQSSANIESTQSRQERRTQLNDVDIHRLEREVEAAERSWSQICRDFAHRPPTITFAQEH